MNLALNKSNNSNFTLTFENQRQEIYNAEGIYQLNSCAYIYLNLSIFEYRWYLKNYSQCLNSQYSLKESVELNYNENLTLASTEALNIVEEIISRTNNVSNN